MFLTRFGHNLKTDEHSFSNTPGSEFWILRNTFSLFGNHFDSFKISKISKKDFLIRGFTGAIPYKLIVK